MRASVRSVSVCPTENVPEQGITGGPSQDPVPTADRDQFEGGKIVHQTNILFQLWEET